MLLVDITFLPSQSCSPLIAFSSAKIFRLRKRPSRKQKKSEKHKKKRFVTFLLLHFEFYDLRQTTCIISGLGIFPCRKLKEQEKKVREGDGRGIVTEATETDIETNTERSVTSCINRKEKEKGEKKKKNHVYQFQQEKK